MKTIKFHKSLSELILRGEKTTTWRLFDDKNLSQNDTISCIISETKEEFAHIRIDTVRETTLGELKNSDWEGHEKFNSEEVMYETYSKYYNQIVTPLTPVKIIKFTVL